jgi:hypothetical protein
VERSWEARPRAMDPQREIRSKREEDLTRSTLDAEHRGKDQREAMELTMVLPVLVVVVLAAAAAVAAASERWSPW